MIYISFLLLILWNWCMKHLKFSKFTYCGVRENSSILSICTVHVVGNHIILGVFRDWRRYLRFSMYYYIETNKKISDWYIKLCSVSECSISKEFPTLTPVPCQRTPPCLLNIASVFSVVKTIELTIKATGSEGVF